MSRPSPPEHFILHFQLNSVAVQEIDQDGTIGRGAADALHLAAEDVMHRRPSLLIAESDAGGFNRIYTNQNTVATCSKAHVSWLVLTLAHAQTTERRGLAPSSMLQDSRWLP